MEWTRITAEIASADAEAACAAAQTAAPCGFYLEDYSDLLQGAREIAHSTLIDDALLAKDKTTARLHLYIGGEEDPLTALEFLKARLDAAGIRHRITTGLVRDEDWADNWKAYFHPVKIGEKLLICPSWETCPDGGRRVLRIDPGAAFGTGTHSTTRLCLQALEAHVKDGAAVLDVGTGSGILSIAALLLGAKSATAVDIDPQSVKTARENGKANGYGEPELIVLKGNLAEKAAGAYDVVCANIVADAVIELAANARRFLLPDGVFIASGILERHLAAVLAAMRAAGFGRFETAEDGGWVCICAK